MKKPDLYIGIDPDVEASGVAVWSPSVKQFKTITQFQFWKLFNFLSDQSKVVTMKVRIEAGWLNNKSNFHDRPGQSKATGERISKNVGSNHQVGKLIVEMCKYLNVEHEEVKPLGKVTPQYFTAITGIKMLKKDQDKIDAAMLVYGF